VLETVQLRDSREVGDVVQYEVEVGERWRVVRHLSPGCDSRILLSHLPLDFGYRQSAVKVPALVTEEPLMAFRGIQRTATSLFTAFVLLLGLFGYPLPAQADGFDPSNIVFPVIGEVTFIDDFDQPRSGGRTHDATDIMGPKMLPVVAAADGVVRWISSSCCHLSIDHGGGWETWYIHLNNDTPGTDDGLAWGIAPGIERDTVVYKGQLIGWLGDSGNAEHTAPHLHFQIFHNGVAINPYEYLLAAPRLSEPRCGSIRAPSSTMTSRCIRKTSRNW
jgi:murein DD-endopeptidase MepM/ murein hydrolase activator NlpD